MLRASNKPTPDPVQPFGRVPLGSHCLFPCWTRTVGWQVRAALLLHSCLSPPPTFGTGVGYYLFVAFSWASFGEAWRRATFSNTNPSVIVLFTFMRFLCNWCMQIHVFLEYCSTGPAGGAAERLPERPLADLSVHLSVSCGVLCYGVLCCVVMWRVVVCFAVHAHA